MTTRTHRMPFGAELETDGKVRFRLWAPPHREVQIELDGEAVALETLGEGWHELVTVRAHAGTQYRFVLPDGLRVPDPASRFQPGDVHGPSEVADPAAYMWNDADWSGRGWEDAVIYEMHIGAFTPEGTFRAAMGKLDYLVTLGITAIEIMPIADFPGRWNWGYDGVLPYAPDSSYGRPDDLKALVEAAHGRGLMVLLDVVYNHFGPEGAYIHAIAPQTFTDRHKTPWGSAINFDGPDSGPVREFVIHNALYWIEEFHLDGLRLDAVHAILDDSPKHILEELAERVRAATPDRHIHLILENEENQAKRLAHGASGEPRWYTAQWNDDIHHVLHVAASGETKGYYADYKADPEKLGRALAEGFAFQGELMPYRGHARGQPSAKLPPAAFVAFIQNHDQVGNRAFGDRITDFAPATAVRAIAAAYLLLPQIPMLFMGEEWGAAQAFPFFCDFGPDLADAVRNGRREEFARFPEFQDPKTRERIPDPLAEQTFASAKLGWEDIAKWPHAQWLDWYRRVLAVRHADIVPRLAAVTIGGQYEVLRDGAVVVRWRTEQQSILELAANLADTPTPGFPTECGHVIWHEGKAGVDGTFGPWAVRWSVDKNDGGQHKNSALDDLAERMGIEPEFRNAHREIVRASTETKRSLLAAMGVRAANGSQARKALDALEQAEWLRPLPPIAVVQTGPEPLSVGLVMPAGTDEIEWRLILEDASERRGRTDFAKLDLLDTRTVEAAELERRRLVLPKDLPWGYHRLAIDPGDASVTLAVTPRQCWLPPALAEGRRLWGIAAQLYLLRSNTDWGIGDFRDLRKLVELAADHGADVIGLNPLHAMFSDDPEHASPYSPASRLLLNVLNIDVNAVPELLDCPEIRDLIASEAFGENVRACRSKHLVDYAGVAAIKLTILERLFNACRGAGNSARWLGFEVFRRERGEVLERNCLFMALREHFARQDASHADWHSWAEEYRDRASPAVARFASEHRHRLDFLAWLQWVADEQLGAAAAAAKERGMAVGLYRDLAVGADRSGAETWANAAAVVSGAQVGAPPDIYNPAGQNWGLPPFHPRALREEGYQSFIDLVRANMRDAGGLRIDHVMGLQRLYWVPQGQPASAGAYVQYPMEDLIGILALESHRQGCLIVGEDLGTVPDGFRERMAEANILSYRVLYFEQEPETGAFSPPAAYPALGLAVIGSHDLPTLRGWWEERDLDLKEQLGLFPGPGEAEHQREMRHRDRMQLLRALRSERLLPPDGEPDVPTLSRAAHAFLARTPSALAMVQIDDLTDEADPVNVPATSDEHPNWRRRLSMKLEELAARPRFIDIAEIFRNERNAEIPRGAPLMPKVKTSIIDCPNPTEHSLPIPVCQEPTMSEQEKKLDGPDFAQGVPLADIAEGGMRLGHTAGDAVLLARRGQELFAIGAECTHYHGPLAEGVLVEDTVRCPWHHACFSLRTGEALRAPALNPVPCWRVELRNGTVYVREKLEPTAGRARPTQQAAPETIVIVGGGAAGEAAAEMLRHEGYSGPITMLSDDNAPPCDRPNLSKDYLAGNAPEEWIPLRPPEFYGQHQIELRLGTRVLAIHANSREVELADGSRHGYGALLLATGAEPVRLAVPGSDLPHIHYLRTLTDSRALIAKATTSRRAVVIGASFIGLEVAASLRARGIEVHVVAPEARPMETVLGPEIGDLIRRVHEEHGVIFHLSTTPTAFDPSWVALQSGERLEADFVVVGIGVRPRTALAEQSGITVDRGVMVSEYLETSIPGIYAAGDIARWPERLTGEPLRIEHWVVAERQGQTAARNMLGARERFNAVPFFWTQQHDLLLNYVGHARQWDRIDVDGQLEAKDCTVTYWHGGRKLAVLTIGRDRDSLAAEIELEKAPTAAK